MKHVILKNGRIKSREKTGWRIQSLQGVVCALRLQNLLILLLSFTLLIHEAHSQGLPEGCETNDPTLQDLRECRVNNNFVCTANDFEIISAFLEIDGGGDQCADCDGNQDYNLIVALKINQGSSSRDALGLYSNLTEGGGDPCSLIRCVVPPEGKQEYVEVNFGPVSYTCGSTLELSDILLVWTSSGSGNTCPIGCPTSKCAEVSDNITIHPPLQASAMPSCDNSTTTSSVLLSTLGGRPFTDPSPYLGYEIKDDNGDVVKAGQISGSLEIAAGELQAGDYTFIVKDSRDCERMVGFTVETCCVFEVECPTNRVLGAFDCTQLDDIPACPTDEASAEATPYNITIGENPCGHIVVLCSDDITDYDVCAAGGQTVTRTVTVFDDLNGNGALDPGEESKVCTYTFDIVKDTKAPTFNEALPADATVSCDDVPAAVTLTASDNCDASVTVDFSEVITGDEDECPSEYTVTRTWTVADCAGNSTSHTQVLTVEDTKAPTFNEALPADATVSCDDVPAAVTLTASDNCDASVTVDFSEVITGDEDECPSEYTVTRTWTVADCAGNSTSHTQVLTVEDTKAPTFNEALPADATVSCDDVPAAVTLTASDNCDASVTVDFSEVITGDEDECPSEYTVTRTWTVADCAGNSTSHTQVLTVEDTKAPTFNEALPADATVSCDDVPAAVTLTASDNCDASVTVDFSEVITGDEDECPSEYTVTRTWTVADCAGNSTSHTQVLTVEDTKAPTFNEALPADATVSCDDVPAAVTLTASDNCDASVTVDFSEVITGDEDECPSEYTVTRTWTVADCAGNSTSHTQVLTVEDTKAPTFNETLPADATVSCDDVPAAVTLTASDNCDASVTVDFSEVITGDEDECPSEYTVTRTWTVADCAGNSTSHTQVLTVEDTKAPTFNEALPADATVSCDDVPAAVTLTASDNCDASVTVDFSEVITGDEDECPSEYTVTRTWTVADCAGNSTSHTQVLTVEDTKAPTFNEALPADATVSCDDVPAAVTLTASDNCDASVTVDFSEVIIPGDGADCYTIKRTWSVEDCAGNSTSHTQTITVEDTKDPIFSNCPADIVISCTDEIPAVTDVEASDNCDDDVSVNYEGETFNYNTCSDDYYTITRTWTAEDNCGNKAECTQEIRVNTLIEVPCFSISGGAEYDQGREKTTFTWEICAIDPDCQALSNIRFSIPCPGVLEDQISDVWTDVPQVTNTLSGSSRRCNKGFYVVFETFNDIFLYPDCGTFSYTFEGDWSGYETEIRFKAGKEKIPPVVVGPACKCEDPASPDVQPENISLTEIADQTVQVDPSDDLTLSAYPNPASSFIRLDIAGISEGGTEIQMVDMLGRQIKSWSTDVAGTISTHFDLTETMRDGIYYLIVKNAGKVKTAPVMVFKE